MLVQASYARKIYILSNRKAVWVVVVIVVLTVVQLGKLIDNSPRLCSFLLFSSVLIRGHFCSLRHLRILRDAPPTLRNQVPHRILLYPGCL